METVSLSHKDNHPQDTINRIRQILHGINIFPYEYSWNNVNGYYSINLKASIYNSQIFSNGKGNSRLYALASAYSEMIERIQNGLTYITEYGLMKDPVRYSDFIEVSKNRLFTPDNNLLQFLQVDISKKIIDEIKDPVICHPFYDPIRDRVEYLPDFITHFTGSNGMAAGNTNEEAIVQGMCEVFERYVIHYIENNKNVVIPTIKQSEINDVSILDKINSIQQKGFSILIKDCTLEGKFPVIGVVILDSEVSKCAVCFGADPIFEIALSRAISELFQGLFIHEIEKIKMIDLSFNDDLNFEDDKNKPAIDLVMYKMKRILNKIVFSDGETKYRNAFYNSSGNKFSNKMLLQFLYSNIIKKSNYNFYIRNVSFLKFPSFFIYIPELSNILENTYIPHYMLLKKSLQKVFLNLENSSVLDLEKALQNIEILLTYDSFKYQYILRDNRSFIHRVIKVSLNDSNILNKLNIEFLLFLLSFRLKKYEKSLHYLNLHVQQQKNINPNQNLIYLNCLTSYLNFKVQGLEPLKIFDRLRIYFPPELVKEIMTNFENIDSFFQKNTFPNCGVCDQCKAKFDCNYEEWKKFAFVMKAEMEKKLINQIDTRSLFV